MLASNSLLYFSSFIIMSAFSGVVSLSSFLPNRLEVARRATR